MKIYYIEIKVWVRSSKTKKKVLRYILNDRKGYIQQICDKSWCKSNEQSKKFKK